MFALASVDDAGYGIVDVEVERGEDGESKYGARTDDELE
jgi:hypothetical protein